MRRMTAGSAAARWKEREAALAAAVERAERAEKERDERRWMEDGGTWEDRAKAAESHAEVLAGALRAVEWGGRIPPIDPDTPAQCTCLACRGKESSGHREGCIIARALAPPAAAGSDTKGKP
jgi:hypothetical protein